VIFESVIDRNSCHPHIHTRLKRIAFRIEAQNRRMLRDSVFEQDHINVVVKVLFLLTRWFLPFQLAGNKSAGTFRASACLRKRGVIPADDGMFNTRKLCLELALTWNQRASMCHK
jgi:hypothetical protein